MINTPKYLAYKIKVDLLEIYSIIENIDSHYTETIIPKLKEGLPLFDKKGKLRCRILNPSHNRLKVMQKRIQKNILMNLKLPDYAYGAVKGRDNVDNAYIHRGKEHKFTTDLRNFFPSISHKKVFEMFRSFNFSPEVSMLLTKLTTYKGRLPQGAPTSSTIANLVFVKTGKKLQEFAEKHKIIFTSFIDDLTFSSPFDFKDITNKIITVLIEDGFRISHNKTNYSREPIVTGLIPSNFVKLPSSFYEKLNDPTLKPESKKGLLLYKQKVDKINKK